MTDVRFVSPRCEEVFTSDPIFRTRTHRCVFREGHVGLHYSDRCYEQQGEPSTPGIMRWGSDPQLYAEMDYLQRPPCGGVNR